MMGREEYGEAKEGLEHTTSPVKHGGGSVTAWAMYGCQWNWIIRVHCCGKAVKPKHKILRDTTNINCKT